MIETVTGPLFTWDYETLDEYMQEFKWPKSVFVPGTCGVWLLDGDFINSSFIDPVDYCVS